MNLFKIYPAALREKYIKNIENSGLKVNPKRYHNKVILISLVITIISFISFYFLKINLLYSLLVLFGINFFFYMKISLKAMTRIKKMEEIFPDVISLMASNLRSGITLDRSFLLSARPEFFPLDEEILRTGRDISTGKDVVVALKDMGQRIDSEKINKIIYLIVSGIKAGGNISDLLEQTSSNMREKEFLEKRASSSILMYVIFILFAIAIGAPILFSLSSVLIQIIIQLSSTIPDVSTTRMDLPLTFNNVGLSPQFIVYFSVVFLIITDFISSLVIGLVNKGESKQGLRYFIPILLFSLSIFFLFRIILLKFLSGMFSLI
ncbi:MAG: type II secretion system F family protein [Candidatus Pacearchaeota archaeon]